MSNKQKDRDINVHLALTPEAVILSSGPAEITFQSPIRQLAFSSVTPAIRDRLHLLRGSGATMEDLLASVALRPDRDRANLVAILMQLTRIGLIGRTLYLGKIPLVSIYAISPHFRQLPVFPEGSYHLSRFAYMRRDEGRFVLESPTAHAQAVLHNWRAAAMLTQTPGNDLFAAVTNEEQQAFYLFLAEAGLMVSLDENNHAVEDSDPALRQWEFHDLLFHGRSRAGRHANALGMTYRFKDEIDPQPMKKPAMSDHVIPLIRPNLKALQQNDMPFAQVLERRRSIRSRVENPITGAQLGEFLYRTCHIQDVLEGEPELSLRPYPSGGALHALEVYVVINRCEGLISGFYHYSPHEHHLEQLQVKEKYQEGLLDSAAQAQGSQYRPSILFLYTARFQRVSWKYSSIAYALILKEVGALQQTMYLVATAMGLAPCALGSGDSDLFSKATGLRYEVESAVGEFTLQ